MRLIAAATATVVLFTGTANAAITTIRAERNTDPIDIKYNKVYWDAGSCKEKEHAVWEQGDPNKEIIEGIKQMQECLAYEPPVPAPVVEEPTYTETTTTTSSSSGGSGCVGMEAESGSAGYNAMSPSGYIGCYQIAPMHYSSGVCTGLGTDPAGQDACAARICASQGAGAWTNAAGANPC